MCISATHLADFTLAMSEQIVVLKLEPHDAFLKDFRHMVQAYLQRQLNSVYIHVVGLIFQVIYFASASSLIYFAAVCCCKTMLRVNGGLHA